MKGKVKAKGDDGSISKDMDIVDENGINGNAKESS